MNVSVGNLLLGSRVLVSRIILCLFLGVSVVLLTAVGGQAQNLLTNPGFDSGDLSGWLLASDPTQSDQTEIAYDGGEGNPAGSALLDRVTSAEFDNKDLIYQLVDVEVGSQYKVDADWMGDLLNGGDGRNWAEALVAFVPTGDPMPDGADFVDDWIQYKRATDGDPNTPAGGTFGWESILDAPDGGPADGVFTATDEWMVLAFNLGGRDVNNNNTQPGFYWVDNASVTFVPEPASLALLVLGGLAALTYRRRS